MVFENNWEYLQAELEHLDLLLRREVLSWRQALPKDQLGGLKGVFISDGEIDVLLGKTPNYPTRKAESDAMRVLAQKARELRSRIAHGRQGSMESGVYLTLPHLAGLFGLSSFEEQVVLLCLAPEIDLKYGKLYAYLQDDIIRKRPSLDLVLKLLCPAVEERVRAQTYFLEEGTLFKAQILRCVNTDGNPLPGRLLRLDDPVVGFLLEIGTINEELATYARLGPTDAGLNYLRWPESLKSQLVSMTRYHFQKVEPSIGKLIFHFHGPRGTGKKTLAAALCKEIDTSLLVVDLRDVLLRSQNFEDTIHRIFRECILLPSALFLEHFDLVVGDDDKSICQLQTIARCVNEFSWLTFIGTEKQWQPTGLFKRHRFFSIELPMPDIKMRTWLWETLANGNGAFSPELDWSEIATKFRFTPGQIGDALVAARNRSHLRARENAVISRDDIFKSCYDQSNQKLALLARKLSPRYTWPDITLPPNALAQLREICAQVKQRRTVYENWGFEEKLSLGKGLCVLFYGQSGTGKTMAVEIIANELKLETYKIDLSTVVSKYIGETEQNLSKIFQEAETSNAILFFDEADALFGKRTEVKDAHDRYANIEINYLLQRMEEFDGLVILATNMRKNIDEAFFRRMHITVEFPFPDDTDRYQIWKQHFPQAAPVADDIDFNFLANRFNITGGNIKNIVVNAAFLAAEDSGVIGMLHVLCAIKREYEKIGRMCSESEFAPYHSLLRVSQG